MSAINPTENTALIVDEFIRYANEHLTTVQGQVNTTSVFPTVPSPTILPGILFWTGYTVQPAKPSNVLREDDFPQKENVEEQNSKPVETTESIEEGVSEEYIEEEIQKRINSSEDVVIATKFNEGKPFRGVGSRGGGFSSGFTGAVTVNLGALNLSAPWPELAAQFIGKNEGFTANASWDVDAYRLGFGTNKIIGADGLTRKVEPGDTTTVEAALKMLQYEVATPYKNRLVGSESYKISEETFNELNDKQKAALISYVYNVGSLRQGIASAIKEKNYALAASRIKEGPITGGGVVYPGLVRRRAEEAALFSS